MIRRKSRESPIGRIHPRLAHVALLAAALSVFCLAEGQQARPAELSVADRVVVASRIYSLIQQDFAHWDGLSRPAFDAAYRDYVDHAVQAKDRKEFDLATLRFVATLKNGHTQFSDSNFDNRPLKFRLLQVENEWVVLESQEARLPKGTVVRTLDGVPVDDFVKGRSQYVAASNERLAKTHVFSIPGLFPDKIAVGLLDGGVVTIDRTIAPVAANASPARAPEGRWLRQGQVAYIRVPSFGDAAYERTAIEFVRQYASAPNLIIDVRGNGGGTTPRQLIAELMNRSWQTWQETTPQHVALFDAQGIQPFQASRPSRTVAPYANAYAGKVYILADRFCGSACEDFVMPFKDTGRATVLGETTQGSSGNPFRADLGAGMTMAVGSVRYRFPNGEPFESVGIAPDVVIERRIADIASGGDATLERALELASAGR